MVRKIFYTSISAVIYSLYLSDDTVKDLLFYLLTSKHLVCGQMPWSFSMQWVQFFYTSSNVFGCTLNLMSNISALIWNNSVVWKKKVNNHFGCKLLFLANRYLSLTHFAYVNGEFISPITFYRSMNFWHAFNEFIQNCCTLHCLANALTGTFF